MTHGISELQLSLIAIGVLSVGGVWGYNTWQERKHRKLAQEVFRSQQHDVLMRQSEPGADTIADVDEGAAQPTPESPAVVPGSRHAERIEPVFSAPEDEAPLEDDLPAAPVAFVPLQDREPVMTADVPISRTAESESFLREPQAGMPAAAPVVEEAEEAKVMTEECDDHLPVLDTVVDREPPLELADDIIDCIVHLNAPELVSAPLFWAAQRQILNRLVNRIVWTGLDENTARWQRLHANDANSYRRLVGALQLADRNGSIAADDLALYCDGVRQLAAHYQAQVIVPVVADVLMRARSLDEFCAAVDWRLSLNLVQREGKGLSLTSVVQLAEVAGLRRRDKTQKVDDGLLHALDAQGRTVFTLALFGGQPFSDEIEGSAAGVTLTLDVPLVTDGVAAFDRMAQLAHLIVSRLDAALVDDQRMPLSDEVLAVIRAKIGEFQQKMATNQLPAGGRRARRLYA